MRSLYILVLSLILLACESDNPSSNPENGLLESITSASVIFVHSDGQLQDFLQEPGLAFISGHFLFAADLAPDVIFGLDIEHLEGVSEPIRFEGADWMALAGFSRNGTLWFPIGSPENLDGVPTPTEKWEIRDFGVELQPNVWYKMTIVCDFENLQFVSVRLEGGGTDKTLSLSGLPLEYPNYAPFDKASLTGYTFALRGTEFAPDNQPGFDVYFDDIQMGIETSTGFKIILTDGFENQVSVNEIPIADIPIPLSGIEENRWYLENEDAKLEISNTVKKSGNQSLKCSADLEQ